MILLMIVSGFVMSKLRVNILLMLIMILLLSGCAQSQTDIDDLEQQVIKLENKVTSTKRQYLNEMTKNEELKQTLSDITQVSYDELLKTNVIIQDWFYKLTSAEKMNIYAQSFKILGTNQTSDHELFVLYDSGIMVYGYLMENGHGELYLTAGSFQYNEEQNSIQLSYLTKSDTYKVSFTDDGLKLTKGTTDWLWTRMDAPSAQ